MTAKARSRKEPKKKFGPGVDGDRLLLSIRAYAKHRRHLNLPGGALSAVQRALLSGRIHRTCSEHHVCPRECRKGGFDPSISDLNWQAWTDPDREPTTASPQEVAQSKAEYFRYRALSSQLDYEQKVGSLAPVQELYAEEFRRSRLMRDAFLPLSRRLASRLAAESDRARVEKILADAIKGALQKVKQAKPSPDAIDSPV